MKRFNVNLVASKAINTSIFTSAIVLFLACFTFVPFATAADVELIENGGFEKPVVTSTKGWTTYFGQNYTSGIVTCPTGSLTCNDGTLIPGWSVVWSHPIIPGPDWVPEPGRVELQTDFYGVIANCDAKDGLQKAELDSHHRLGDTRDNNATIYQVVKTCPGLLYTFKYSWKGRDDVVGESNLDVLIDDVFLTEHVTFKPGWTDETLELVANQWGETIVAFHSCGDANTLGVFLDEISLVGPDGSDQELCDQPVDCEFGDKPISLTVRYDGDDDTSHNQITDEVIITPEFVADYPDPAYIMIYGNNKNKGALYEGTYAIGEDIVITGPRNRIPSRLKFEIRDPADGYAIAQSVQFHTSCSQPLSTGDDFGGITVLSAIQ